MLLRCALLLGLTLSLLLGRALWLGSFRSLHGLLTGRTDRLLGPLRLRRPLLELPWLLLLNVSLLMLMQILLLPLLHPLLLLTLLLLSALLLKLLRLPLLLSSTLLLEFPLLVLLRCAPLVPLSSPLLLGLP